MSKYSTEHKRKVFEGLKRDEKQHQERQGKQPTQREIDKQWNNIANKLERQGKI